MANIKSSIKRARTNEIRRQKNLTRRSALKTAIKNVLTAVEAGKDAVKAQAAFKIAEEKIARAKGKGLIHANTAARKISRLAKKVAALSK